MAKIPAGPAGAAARRARALSQRDSKALSVIPEGFKLAPAVDVLPVPLELPLHGVRRETYESLAEALAGFLAGAPLAGMVFGVAAPVYVVHVGPRSGVTGSTFRAWSVTFRQLYPGDRLELSSCKAKTVALWPCVKDLGYVVPPPAPPLDYSQFPALVGSALMAADEEQRAFLNLTNVDNP